MRTLLSSVLLACSASLAFSAQQPVAPADPQAAPPLATQAPAPVVQAPAPNADGSSPTVSAPTSANTIRRNVSLVVLDGVALDTKGNVVTNLQKSDFQIVEDGAPQTVRNFVAPGANTPSADVDIESTADLGRLAPRAPVNIILLDEFTTRFEDMAFGRYSLKKWLDKQPGRLSAPTMLVAVDLQHFTVLRDYTQNKDLLLNALDNHFATYPWQTHQFAWVAERYSTAFNTLRRVAEATSGHLGHKNMVWIGRGLPTINYANYNMDAQRQVRTAVQLTVDELRDARVTLYTIDPAGLMTDPGKYGSGAEFYPFGGNPDFEDLSRATGGRSLHGRNDVDAQIGTAIQDNASLFTLTYAPTNPGGDPNTFKTIKVTINRPGVTFLTRKGYYPAIRPARLGPDGQVNKRLAAELVNAATSNMAYDGLGFIAQVKPSDVNDIKVVVQSPGLTYYNSNGSKPRFTKLIVLVTTYDKKNKLLKENARTLTFEAPPSVSPTGHLDLPVGFDFKIDPDAKATHARIVVRVDGSGHMGTADIVLAPGALANSSSADLSALHKSKASAASASTAPAAVDTTPSTPASAEPVPPTPAPTQ